MPTHPYRTLAVVRRSPRRRTALLATPALLFSIAFAHADVAPPIPQKPAGKVATTAMNDDQAASAQLSAFLKDYHHALEAGDRKFLGEHTVFPLPFAEGVYDMEAKVKSSKLASVAALLKVRQKLQWPQELVPKSAEDLSKLRRGAEKCSDPKSPDVPDYSQGDPAIEVKGDHASLTYLASPCESETHVVILSFVRSGASWRLAGRAARVGTK